jgi:hypothetical protein
MAYSLDLRKRVVDYVENGGGITKAALHNSSMLSIASPQGTNIFQLVIGTVLCFK